MARVQEPRGTGGVWFWISYWISLTWNFIADEVASGKIAAQRKLYEWKEGRET